MNKNIIAFIIPILISFYASQSSSTESRLLVKFKKSCAATEKKKLYSQSMANHVRQFKSIKDLEALQFPTEKEANSALELYRKHPEVIYAEHDYRVNIADAPNDERFSSQWGLQNMGLYSGKNDIDINAPEAWAIFADNSNVVIGIIDTGIDYNHPDLVKNLWVNPKEIANNQIDDDRNGYIDDVYGINVINGSGNPLDDNNHGSHVAGIIAATGNNQIGISGILQNAQIISCKFLDSFGSGSVSDAITCLDYFSTLNANIIATNNSWGGGDYSQALYEAISNHLKEGILFVTAAGNNSADNDRKNFYPSNYILPNIISVAAIDRNGKLANFSNYGRYTVQAAAPGVSILSTIVQDYGEMDGTSMATPFVTGLAGLIKAYDSNANWSNIKNRIIASGKSLNALKTSTLTGKLIRAYDDENSGALNCENQILAIHTSPPSDAISFEIGSKILLSAININCGNSLGNVNAIINNNKNFIIPDDGTKNDLSAHDGIATREWIPDTLGTYQFAFSQKDVTFINIYNSSNWQTYGQVSSPAFEYRNVNGIKLDSGDETISILNSPFAFPFAGGGASHFILYIGSNGTISLTDSLLPNFYNLPLPSPGWVSLVSPYWDDLKPIEDNFNSGIFYDILGEAPQRELVIEWRNMQQYNLTNNDITFEVVFFENKPDILFNYLDTDCEDSEYSDGKSATIGIQTKSNSYKLFSFNTASVASRYSLLFKPGISDSEESSNNGHLNRANSQKKPLHYMHSIWQTILKQRSRLSLF